MGTRGLLLALDEADERGLLDSAAPPTPKGFLARLGFAGPKVSTDSAVLEFVQSVEERWDEAWLCETDSAWDAIHRALGDGTLSHTIAPLGKAAMLGGTQLYSGDDHMIVYKSSALVREVAAAIVPISDEAMGARYDGLDPNQYGFPKDENDRTYTVDWFGGVRDFYAKAAEAGRAVVFLVSQ